MAKASIYEVAKKSGVSIMTVSRAFSKPDQVNKETREKILKIADELKYRPSMVARSMRTKKTFYLALILPDIMNSFFPEIVRGVDDYARQKNYNTILINTDNDYKIQYSLIDTFIDKNVDGIIMGGIAGGKKDTIFINRIIKEKIPIVLVDRYIPGIDLAYVITDNYKAGYEATEYLIKRGHKHIATVCSSLKTKIFQDRLRGYRDALTNNSIDFNENLVIEGEEILESGYFSIKELHSSGKKFTAVFAMCDFIAFGIYKYCKEKSINIPDEISVISIDDVFTSSIISPALTTMAQQKYEMGYNAARILIDGINKSEFPVEQLVLDPKLIERESCKKL